MTDLADVQAADDLYETAIQALDSAQAVRRDARDTMEAAKARYEYWCGVEARALVAVERANRDAVDARRAAALVLTAGGYQPAS